jgi:hypothetical protein
LSGVLRRDVVSIRFDKDGDGELELYMEAQGWKKRSLP